jgi:hypothetical protein
VLNETYFITNTIDTRDTADPTSNESLLTVVRYKVQGRSGRWTISKACLKTTAAKEPRADLLLSELKR